MGGGALVMPEAPATRARTPASPGWEVAEPALADLPGRATFAEVEAVVDRWVLGRVLGEQGGNVTMRPHGWGSAGDDCGPGR